MRRPFATATNTPTRKRRTNKISLSDAMKAGKIFQGAKQMEQKLNTAGIIFVKGALKALNRVARETEKQKKELEALLQNYEEQDKTTN
jgi:hypothetical protein